MTIPELFFQIMLLLPLITPFSSSLILFKTGHSIPGVTLWDSDTNIETFICWSCWKVYRSAVFLWSVPICRYGMSFTSMTMDLAQLNCVYLYEQVHKMIVATPSFSNRFLHYVALPNIFVICCLCWYRG